MKRFNTILTVLLMSGVFAFGQDILDVPPWDGTNGTPLVDVIAGDTTETGDRVSDNRVYRLERDGVYMITSTLFTDYSFSMVGADGDGRPPILISAKNAEGAVVLPFINALSNDETYLFKDVIFQAINTDLQQTIWTSAFMFNGNNCHITFDHCIFNAWTGRSVNFLGANTTGIFRDVIWRNSTHTDHPFVGQQIMFAEIAQDTFIVTNSTHFNSNGFWSYHRNGIMDYCVIEHNTFYIAMTTLINQEHMVNGYIRSNIFYGMYAHGDHPISRRDKWYTSDSSPASIMNFDPMADTLLSDAGLTKADRSILLTHNAYYTPQAFQDYYASNDTVDGAAWLNTRMQAMFDDDDTYPLLVAENNVEIDPVFANTAMDTWEITENAKAVAEFHAHPEGAFWGTTSSMRNYDATTGIDQDLLLIPWPLLEGNMEITAASLMTAGHDGLPMGNLNWDPDSRAQYREPHEAGVGVEEMLQNPSGISLSHNYPNPFSNQTSIAYSLSRGADVTISVYNVMGQEVANLVNNFRTAGSYSVVWDASDVPAGIYTFRIKADGFAQTKKMMKLK